MISICIITKNEAKNLKMCLKNLKNTGFEIVVVDTGSTDDTKSVANEFTNKIYDFDWCDDFSAARNYAISKASNDVIMMVDSDEFLTEFDKDEFVKRVERHPQEVGRIHLNNIFIRDNQKFSNRELLSRVFSKKYFHYTGKIHEQITSLEGKGFKTYTVPVYLEHSGYNGGLEERKRKSERNIMLLLKSLQDNGEDPYIFYQLGKSYYMKEDYIKAAEYFEKTFAFELDENLEYVIDLMEMYGYALINSKQYEKALMLESLYDEFYKSADFVFMMGNVYMQNAMFEQAVMEFLKASKYDDSKVEGVTSYLAFYNIGVIYECLGKKDAAIKYYKKCGNYELAKQGLKRLR